MAATGLTTALRPRRFGVPRPLLRSRSDDVLVERVSRGDEIAFEVLYERYGADILSFCRHMLGSREEAEDAVQHVFAAVHRELAGRGRELNLKPWLYTVARNRCLTIIRARREQPVEEADSVIEGLSADVGKRADLRELVSDLRDLPEDQREALVLTELGDLSHAEVADVLGRAEGAVKGIVFRARAGLIERREARAAPCGEIREELAVARKGTLRKGRLRHHLRACPECTTYLEEVRAQRRAMAALLPVVPSAGLRDSILAILGAGGGGGGAAVAGLAGAGGTGAVAGIASALSTGAAKVGVAAAVIGSAGFAGQAALDHRAHPPVPPPAAQQAAPGPNRVSVDSGGALYAGVAKAPDRTRPTKRARDQRRPLEGLAGPIAAMDELQVKTGLEAEFRPLSPRLALELLTRPTTTTAAAPAPQMPAAGPVAPPRPVTGAEPAPAPSPVTPPQPTPTTAPAPPAADGGSEPPQQALVAPGKNSGASTQSRRAPTGAGQSASGAGSPGPAPAPASEPKGKPTGPS